MNFSLTDKASKYAEKLQLFMDQQVFPAETAYYSQREEFMKAGTPHKLPPIIEELKQKAKAQGLWNLFLPHLDHGLSVTDYATLAEITGWSPDIAPEAINCAAPDTGNMELLDMFASPQQKKQWLEPLLAGEIRSGFAMTEPDVASSDARNIRTSIKRDGDDYIINGTKSWISNGIEGSCFALLVKTDPAAEPRHHGMAMFIAEKGPGFTVSRKLEKLGYKGIDSAELVFTDYRIPADRLIGGVEGKGLACAIAGLELGRVNVAARGVGVAKRALDEAVRYSQQRKTFGKFIHQHQAIALKLADMAVRVEAARLLTEKAAHALDRGDRSDYEAGMAKLFATEAAVENSLEAMRIHGGYGYSKEFVVERLYRDAPLLVIGEGTNEIQRLVIAKRLIEKNPI